MFEVLGIASLFGGLVAFLVGLFSFIGLMSCWSNTGKTAAAVEELVKYQRIERGLDLKTGKDKGVRPIDPKTLGTSL